MFDNPGARLASVEVDAVESSCLVELHALVTILNRRGVTVELVADLHAEAEYHAVSRRMILAADITPSRLRRLRGQVAGRLLSGQW